jgi:hypothetical protein
MLLVTHLLFLFKYPKIIVSCCTLMRPCFEIDRAFFELHEYTVSGSIEVFKYSGNPSLINNFIVQIPGA